MTIHSANRPTLTRAESMPSISPKAPKDELPSFRPQAGNAPPPSLTAQGSGTRQRLLKSASSGNLPGRMKATGQNKVAQRENNEEGSNKQGGQDASNGKAPKNLASKPHQGIKKPADKPTTQPATSEGKGHPFLDLIGKFGEVILHGMELVNKLYAQLTDMVMATFSRASKSADQANRL